MAKAYDIKWLHREVLNSDTYQRSWKPNVTNVDDEKNFSRAVIHRLPAEVVLDAINIANDLSKRAIGHEGDVAAATYSSPIEAAWVSRDGKPKIHRFTC